METIRDKAEKVVMIRGKDMEREMMEKATTPTPKSSLSQLPRQLAYSRSVLRK